MADDPLSFYCKEYEKVKNNKYRRRREQKTDMFV